MRRRRPFRRMLFLWLAAFAAALVVAVGLFVALAVRSALYENLDRSLLEIAATEVASSTDSGYVHVHDTLPSLLEVAGHPGYEKYVWIEDLHEGLLARTPNLVGKPKPLTDPEVESEAKRGKIRFGWAQAEGVRLRAVYYPGRDAAGHPLLAVVAVPIAPVEQSVESLLRWILAMALCSLAGGLLVAWRLSKTLSEPLRRFAAAAQQIGDSHAPQAIEVAGGPTEIEETVASTNRMLRRLAAAGVERERLVERLRSFMADFSHEIRTPLANVVGTVDVCLRKPRSVEEYREALDVVRAETDRAAKLVQDMLLLASADSGQLEPQIRLVDMASIVLQAVSVAQRSTVGIEWSLESMQDGAVCADPAHLRQAIDNILGNACRHAASMIRVRVETTSEEVAAIFENDGPPLSKEELERAFERFYRGDASRARSSGGAGLGLAIARSLVALQGGRIEAMNGGLGVCFRIVLPARHAEDGCCPPHEAEPEEPIAGHNST